METRQRALLRRGFVLGLLLTTTGCGTYVPELREFPNYTQADTQNMISAIVQSVRCELSNAITSVVNNEISEAPLRRSKRTYYDFLDGWGAEVTLTFTIVEKTAVAPSVLWTPPSPASSVFTLATGLSGSTQATRIEKMNFFLLGRRTLRSPMQGERDSL